MQNAIQAEQESITTDPMTVFLTKQEQAYLVAVMQETGGNKAEAARRAGMSKANFYRKLKQHGIRVVPQAPEIVAGHYDD